MVDIIRNHPRSVNPLIKSNNLLNNALGHAAGDAQGGVEGVFRNYRGELSECSQSNLFIVKDGVAADAAARSRAARRHHARIRLRARRKDSA